MYAPSKKSNGHYILEYRPWFFVFVRPSIQALMKFKFITAKYTIFENMQDTIQLVVFIIKLHVIRLNIYMFN